MKLASHLLKTTVSFGWSETIKKNAEKKQRQIDGKLKSILGETNMPAEKNCFWILMNELLNTTFVSYQAILQLHNR